MKDKLILVISLLVAGVITYLMFSGNSEGIYHFPWEVFAGLGVISWIIQELVKEYRKLEKEVGK